VVMAVVMDVSCGMQNNACLCVWYQSALCLASIILRIAIDDSSQMNAASDSSRGDVLLLLKL
jgi:hypothetical protein